MPAVHKPSSKPCTWVPDVQSPAFAAEARRQSLAVAPSPHAADDQMFIDAVSWLGDNWLGDNGEYGADKFGS